MELFNFFRDLFAWMTTVAIFLPISIPMAAFAYKVRNGPKPIDMEPSELWYRATLAAVVLALVSAAFLWLDWLIVDGMDFPSGAIHLTLVMGYIPVGMWVMTYYFGFSDLLDGLSTFTMFIGLPVVVLWLINAVTGLWNWPLGLAYGWLKEVTV